MAGPFKPVGADDDGIFPERVEQRLAADFSMATSATRVLRAALDAGFSTAFGWRGDSTGDSDGLDPAHTTTPTHLARMLGEKYPGYHVMSKMWNPTSETFDPWVTLQAQPAGRAYAQFAGRSIRWNPDEPLRIGNEIEIEMRIAADDWTPNAPQALACQMIGDRGYTEDFAWWLQLLPSGALSWRWYMDNGSNAQQNLDSTVPLPAPANGQWLNIKTTLVVVPGVSHTIEFFTRTDDAETWTKLGATLHYENAGFLAINPSTTAFIEVGGAGWQPAGDTFTGKISEVCIRAGVDGYTVAPCLPALWERYADASTTYHGAPTLIVMNASRSSSDLAYHRDPVRLSKMTPDYGQVVEYFNDSHNEGGKSGPKDWTLPYAAWVNEVLERVVQAQAVVVGQNPHTSEWPNEAAYGISHQFRIAELAALASRRGWGYLDLFSAFIRADVPLSELIAAGEGLHPSPLGYEFAGTVALRQIV